MTLDEIFFEMGKKVAQVAPSHKPWCETHYFTLVDGTCPACEAIQRIFWLHEDFQHAYITDMQEKQIEKMKYLRSVGKTYREIATLVGFKSPSSVKHRLDKLA